MNLSPEAKGLLKGIPIISVIGAVIGFFAVPSVVDTSNGFFDLPMNINFVIGVAIGALLSAVKVVFVEKAVDKALSQGSAQKATLYMHLTYIPRLLFTVATLAISVYFFGIFGILGAVVGNVSLTISAYLIKFLNRKSRGKEDIV